MTEDEFFQKADDAESREWFATRPLKVREAILTAPPFWCYKMKDENGTPRGHYWLMSYEEHEADEPVTVKVAHGSDSYLPGIAVFGCSIENLVKCDCGKWKQPTDAQVEETRVRLEAEKAKVALVFRHH